MSSFTSSSLILLLSLVPLGKTSFCSSSSFYIGCVSQNFIAEEKTYLVEFQDDTSGDSPDICWKTCELIYPNTSLAIVSWNGSSSGLDCHCGLEDAIDLESLGPEIFCNQRCEAKGQKCGGSHLFNNGLNLAYFSVYCIPSKNITALLNRQDMALAMEPNSSDINDQLESTKQILRDIWFVMMRNNIISIVIVGLLVLVVILVIALLVWAYLFLENYDKSQEGRSLFYRRLSGSKKPIANDRKEIYGSTNRAYESEGPQSDHTTTTSTSAASAKDISTVAGRSTFFGWINSQGQISEEDKTSQESVQTELAEETKANGTT